MILYFLRHGKAQPRSGTGGDSDLALIPEGQTNVKKIVSLAKDNFACNVDRILSSPYKRAVETAEIAKEILKPRKPKIITDAALAPERTPYELYSFIAKQNFLPLEGVLVVSHQPIIGQSIADLIGLGVNFGFSPGSMARIDVAGEPTSRSGNLVWLISSDVV